MSNSFQSENQASELNFQRALTFFDAMLPEEGKRCLTLVEGVEGNARNLFFDTNEQLARAAIAWDRKQEGTHDHTFFACGTYKNSKNRRATNVHQLQTFWQDVDAGPDKPYAHARFAAQAMLLFCQAVKLPFPTIVISGRGIHAYWRLERPLSLDQWKPIAEGVKNACITNGAHIDAHLAANAASVLRPPATHHRKGDPIQVFYSKIEDPVPLSVFERFAITKPRLAPPKSATSAPPRSNIFITLAPDLQDIRQRLPAISAAPRDTWLHVGMSLHSVTEAYPHLEALAREVWDEWSATASKIFNSEDQEKTWNGFEHKPEGRKIGSLIHDIIEAEKKLPEPIVLPMVQGAPTAASPDPDGVHVLPAAEDAPGAPHDPADVITAESGKTHAMTDKAEAVLIKRGVNLYVLAESIVRPIVDVVPASKKRTTIVARLRELTNDSMFDVLSRETWFQKFDARVGKEVDGKKPGKFVRISPPRDVASMLLSRTGLWNFPRVAGIICVPMLRPDGSILDKPGYDRDTRLYLMADKNLVMPPISEHPSRDEALEALTLLKELLREFPFVSEADRSVALSGILTATLRGAMSVAPMHLIRASTPGTGKSYLIDVASAIATGRICPVNAWAKGDEENEKRLGAMLREGMPIINIDNIEGEIGGSALCQMVSQAAIRIRVLGRSSMPEFENRAMLFANGNNCYARGDMVRRVLICDLDAEVERPELRAFTFKPYDRVLEDRGRYVAACLSIARAYKAAGSPEGYEKVEGFDDWTWLVQGALVWLGEVDPARSMEKARDEDPELTAIQELFGFWPKLEAWRENRVDEKTERPTDGAFTASEINSCAGEYGYFHELLMRVAGVGTEVSRNRLGMWLKQISGRPCDGQVLRVKHDKARGNRYVLQRVSTHPEGVLKGMRGDEGR